MSEPSDDDMQAFAPDAALGRRHRRWFVDFETTVALDGRALSCTVLDLSPGGACVRLLEPGEMAAGAVLEFELPGYGPISAEVRYDASGELGLMFLHEEDGEVEVARYLVAIEQNRPSKHRDVQRDVVLRAGGVELTCILSEISRLGATVLVDETRHLSPDQEVTLDLPDVGRIPASVQRVEGREVGLAFLQQLEDVPSIPAAKPDADA